LEALKGDKTWDEFLREIAEEIMRKRREEARRELARLLEAEEVERAKWSRY
jgi:formate dehydrogenase maturation protein FdhE